MFRLAFELPDDLLGFRVQLNDPRAQSRAVKEGIGGVGKEQDVAVRQHLGIMLLPELAVLHDPFKFFSLAVDDGHGVVIAPVDQEIAVVQRAKGIGVAEFVPVDQRVKG